MSSSSLFVPSLCSSETTITASLLNEDGLTSIVLEVSEGGMGGVVPVAVTSTGLSKVESTLLLVMLGHPLCLVLDVEAIICLNHSFLIKSYKTL
ncbi:hypothetical protein GOBAR_DD30527 [Gossypium barbadense]|nr:hypothetical protein GOBAR_DD30527 [Gossypium barbadense]